MAFTKLLSAAIFKLLVGILTQVMVRLPLPLITFSFVFTQRPVFICVLCSAVHLHGPLFLPAFSFSLAFIFEALLLLNLQSNFSTIKLLSFS